MDQQLPGGVISSHGKSQEHKSTSQTLRAHLKSLLMSHPLTFVGQSKANIKGARKYILPALGVQSDMAKGVDV